LGSTQFNPSVEVSVSPLDNLFLVPSDLSTTSDLVTEVRPRLSIQESGARSAAALDYTMRSLFYEHNNDLNRTVHQGVANGVEALVKDLLFVRGNAAYTQETADPTKPENFNNLFGTGNAINRGLASVAPYVTREFGNVKLLARYSYGIARYSGALPSDITHIDSHGGLTNLQLSSVDRSGELVWDTAANSTRVIFKNGDHFKYDKVFANLAVGVAPSWWLLAGAGEESNLLNVVHSGGLHDGLWSGGLRWRPDEKNSFEFTVGHRFFGRAFSGAWLRQSRLLGLSVTYTEEPTTDSVAATFVEFTPGVIETVGPAGAGDFARPATEPYLDRELKASIKLTGARTYLELSVNHLRRDYLLIQREDKIRGAAVEISRALSPADTLVAIASYSRAALLEQASFTDRRFSVEYTHHLTSTLTMVLSATRLTRSGGTRYAADVGTLLVRKTF
jgi:hypothetical protein